MVNKNKIPQSLQDLQKKLRKINDTTNPDTTKNAGKVVDAETQEVELVTKWMQKDSNMVDLGTFCYNGESTPSNKKQFAKVFNQAVQAANKGKLEGKLETFVNQLPECANVAIGAYNKKAKSKSEKLDELRVDSRLPWYVVPVVAFAMIGIAFFVGQHVGGQTKGQQSSAVTSSDS